MFPRIEKRLRRLILGFTVASPLLICAGCVTPTGTPPETALEQKDPLALPDEFPIGTVIRVDPKAGIALIEVDSASTRVTPTLTSRNQSFIETAVLEPTRFRSGRILGTKIVSGLPNVGDEVITTR